MAERLRAVSLAGFEARVVELSWYGDRSVHAPLGKTSFPAQSLVDNAHALVDSVVYHLLKQEEAQQKRPRSVAATGGDAVLLELWPGESGGGAA